MTHKCLRSIVCCGILMSAVSVRAFEAPPLTAEEAAAAAADYQQYCALCHGDDRQGYANDYAPSLRSKSLIRSGFPELILFTIAYGRRGTPMGGYFDEIGGPMDNPEIYRLTRWLKEQVGVESIDLPADRVTPLRAADPSMPRLPAADRCASRRPTGAWR